MHFIYRSPLHLKEETSCSRKMYGDSLLHFDIYVLILYHTMYFNLSNFSDTVPRLSVVKADGCVYICIYHLPTHSTLLIVWVPNDGYNT